MARRNGEAEKARATRLPEWDALALQRAYRLLGLGVRARSVIVGVEQVRDAAKRGKLVLALVAADASPNSVKKVVPLLAARRISFIEVPSSVDLGLAVGRDHTAAVGVVDPRLAKGILVLDLKKSGPSRALPEGV